MQYGEQQQYGDKFKHIEEQHRSYGERFELILTQLARHDERFEQHMRYGERLEQIGARIAEDCGEGEGAREAESERGSGAATSSHHSSGGAPNVVAGDSGEGCVEGTAVSRERARDWAAVAPVSVAERRTALQSAFGSRHRAPYLRRRARRA